MNDNLFNIKLIDILEGYLLVKQCTCNLTLFISILIIRNKEESSVKKHKSTYQIQRYRGPVIRSHKEISFEIQLRTRLLLDELSFQWNKEKLQKDIDRSIDESDRAAFMKLSHAYKAYA